MEIAGRVAANISIQQHAAEEPAVK
jgi:hypothetical protein